MKNLWFYFLSFFGGSEYERLGGATRSSQWGAVRAKHLRLHPRCEVCETEKKLEVHHETPFYLAPRMELVESNLITLCAPHHFTFGHFCSWRSYNMAVREDAAVFLSRIAKRP